MLGTDPTVWESLDGLNWQPRQSSNLRIDMAIYDPRDPDPQQRFKGALENKGFAVSSDGITWRRRRFPLSQARTSRTSAMTWHQVCSCTASNAVDRTDLRSRDRNQPRLSVLERPRSGLRRRRRGPTDRTKNIDARLADRTFEPLRYNDPEAWNVDVYNMGIFWYESLFIGMPAMYHATRQEHNYPNTDGFHLIQLVTSRDLKDWNRVADRQTFIGPSRTDSARMTSPKFLRPSAAGLPRR